jgi:hypothetical protein
MNRREALLVGALLVAAKPEWSLAQGSGKSKSSEAAKMTAGKAVNIAGRQRMLSQRAAKCYAQIGVNVMAERSFKALGDIAKLMDTGLRTLQDYATTANARQLLAEQEKLFGQLNENLRAAPDKTSGANVLAISEEFLKNAQAVTQEIEKSAANASAAVVNISGRQRMLSQRIAKFYFFNEWGLAPGAVQEIKRGREEFVAAMLTLKSSALAIPAIKNNLTLGETQWLFFEQALMAQQLNQTDAVNRNNVATTSERLLEIFETVTGQFEQAM